MSRRRASLLLVALLVQSGAARAEPQDPRYPERALPQQEPAPRLIEHLVWPAFTAPALVRAGGRFSLLLVPPASSPASSAPDPRAWRATLLRPGAPGWPCPIRTASRRRGLLELSVEVPPELARDVYDLRVMGPGIDESRSNAVRVTGAQAPESYRFAVIGDHQLWDPSYLAGRELNARSYPRRDKEASNLGIARQGLAELALLDPEFVLHVGDLCFGLDYPTEYGQVRSLLAEARLPLFAVPGNHDGYAEYKVRLRGGVAKVLGGLVACRDKVPGELTWEKAWALLRCLYGDIKHLLYADLRRDGLLFWRRQLGPPAFSFEHGRLRFVGLNTFDGSPQRRHAFSVYVDLFDMKLGAPAVDNHGGYLGAAQLSFLRDEAARARQRGQTLVVFGHHDPRGNPEPPRYHPNEPFPTDPLALGGFEEWNFDGAAWDSDPADGRATESEERNSALELLSILAEHGGYFLSGHVHKDERQVYEPGSRLGAYRVQRRLEIIRTTTASAAVRGDSYWGYRMIQVRGDRLEAVDYAPERGLGAVPAGNLWLARRPPEKGADEEVTAHSGLPQPTSIVVAWELLARTEGWRFRPVTPGDGAPRVLEIGFAGGRALYRLGLDLPAAAEFPPSSTPPGYALRALPATGNTAPRPQLEVAPLGGQPLPPGPRFKATVGRPLLLSADRSTDGEGDRIVAYLWDLGEGRTARGPRLVHTFSGPGRRQIALTLVDEAGARSRLTVEAQVEPPRAPGCAGCCAPTSEGQGKPAAAAAPLLLLLLAARRRRPRR